MTSLKKLREQEDRIAAVFPPKLTDHSRRLETLKRYKKYLEEHLELPVKVAAIEHFDWEEFYVMGPGDKEEYEQLKKRRPSYSDIFELLEIQKEYDDFYGLFAAVRRLSDKKRFSLPLQLLTSLNSEPAQSQLLDDYIVWFVNY